MAEFVMPTLGADMTEGTLVQWKKRIGDRIAKGEIIAEVDTEKAAIDVECHTTGIIERLITKPGDKVPVGTVMAIIREEGGPTTSVSFSPGGRHSTVAPLRSLPSNPERCQPVAPSSGRVPDCAFSPAARKLAAERGIDPASTLQGTGPEGAITLDDIDRVHSRATTDIAKPVGTADRQARMRQTIAAAMARSKREIPHYYLSTTIDMGRAITWLKDSNEQRPVTERLLYGVLLIKASPSRSAGFPSSMRCGRTARPTGANGFISAPPFPSVRVDWSRRRCTTPIG
jgi:pyruvate dehydrogenase E2 component (dihydrolipoamide acetyltransferase)